MAKAPTHSMKKRMIVILVGMIVCGFCVVLHQLFKLQIIDHDLYQTYALNQQMKTKRIGAKRGTIYDTNMKPLARSATVWSVCVAPGLTVDKDDSAKTKRTQDAVVDCLYNFLEIPKDKAYKYLERTNSLYEVVKEKVEKPQADALMAAVAENSLVGMIFLEEDTRRYYPFGNFASTVIGFTNKDNIGAYGLESYYEKILAGTPGRVVALRDGRNVSIPLQYEQPYAAKDGNSLVLTIDENIQHFLEKNIETAVYEHKVRNRVAGIVMDVKTGAILAMSTKPDFDPNNPTELLDENLKKSLEEQKKQVDELNTVGNEEAYKVALDEYNKAKGAAQYGQWRNKAISDPYEPGSVFKIITTAGALESGAVTLQSSFYCPGFVEVAGNVLHCWVWGSRLSGHGQQDLTHAVMNSCNPAFVDIGQREGVEAFMDYFRNFGLTEPTGIDLPGEAGSIYHQTMGPADLASSSFGQTFKVTPIQLITACVAAVNGGNLMQPYVVKQIIDPEGNVVSTTEPVVKRQVISEDISNELCLILEQVVSGGSGKQAKIPGYRVGGKTGTSEQLDKRKNGVTPNTLSFFGFAPIDDPQVACLVLLDSPDIYNAYGSTIAAPIVGSVLSEVLPYMGIEAQYTEDELQTEDIRIEYIIGRDIHDAQSVLRAKGIKFRTVGNGTKVVRQVPGAAEILPAGGTVILYTEENASEQITVPDVTGMTAEEANKAIGGLGLMFSMSGETLEGVHLVAVSQSPTAGETVEIGTAVRVEFKETEPPPQE